MAVAYWMGGIAGQYTKFEKVEIQSAVCTWNNDGYWQIEMKLKNTGTATTTLTNAFINDIEIANYDQPGWMNASTTATDMDDLNPTTINSGDSTTVTIWVDQGYMTLSSGTTVNIKLHSAGGMDYIKLIELV